MPNTPVDVNSWGVSACYPQGSFYPLSDGPSTRYRLITNPDFRPCSTCLSRSQAPLCICARCTISNRAEGTFGRLRYSLGGDRPSQTTHLTLSHHQIHGGWLDTKLPKGGIPTLTPRTLTCSLPSLPPILYINNPISILSYSKAPWGLSV